jgi:3-oxoacyl-[acyl-carrier-protein] synthase-1
MTAQPLILSEFCLVTCLGAGQDATLSAMRAGTSGLGPCSFETVALPTRIGEVTGVDSVRIRPDLIDFDCRNNRLAQMALEQDGFAQAVAAARDKYGRDRIGLFLGTSTSGILQSELAYRRRDKITGGLPADFNYAQTQNTFSVADFVMRYLDLDGPAVVLSSACASTAKVFASATRMIAAGLCDAAIVGGADSLCLTTLYGFHSLNLLSEEPCRPFDVDRKGISIGEGAGFALIEKPIGTTASDDVLLLGVGESNDAYHMSSPHPEGAGACLAMERALAAAGLTAEAIDYINLHGTATHAGDASEDHAIARVFGTATPCSSTKGQTGHMLGAAGITEAIISALAIRNGVRPGGANTRDLDPALASRYCTTTVQGTFRRVMSNSFGFGGSNCAIILGRAG